MTVLKPCLWSLAPYTVHETRRDASHTHRKAPLKVWHQGRHTHRPCGGKNELQSKRTWSTSGYLAMILKKKRLANSRSMLCRPEATRIVPPILRENPMSIACTCGSRYTNSVRSYALLASGR